MNSRQQLRSLVEVDDVHETVTAGELIQMLQDVAPETPVYYAHQSGDHWRTVLAGGIRDAELKAVKHSGYHNSMAIDDEPDYEESDDVRVQTPGHVLVLSH